jgi:nanoRNase/pAp phosphatase (c-di-AMP/oligoRNAs hydrolase)
MAAIGARDWVWDWGRLAWGFGGGGRVGAAAAEEEEEEGKKFEIEMDFVGLN